MNTICKLSLTVLGAGLTGFLVNRRREPYSFRHRVVAITGGSRGLGYAMARQLVLEGAQVALLARSAEELESARQELALRGGDVRAYVCDVSDLESTAAAMAHIEEDYGRLDVLINNAGIILCAPFETQRDSDFQEAWKTHVLGPLHTMRAALPMMRRQGGGRIVNISSIGGKIGVPHMASYCASKYALVGLSHSLAAELRSEGIYVTVACPGLMRTGSHRNAAFRGQQQEEFNWFATLSGTPFISMHADKAAQKILEAGRRRRAEIVFPWYWSAASLGARFFPGAAVAANALVNRFLPASAETPTAPRRGAELSETPPPAAVAKKLEAAVARHQPEGR